MEIKNKRGLLSKTWDRCKSFSDSIGRRSKGSLGNNIQHAFKIRSKSLPRGFVTSAQSHRDTSKVVMKKRPRLVAPDGCFSIYVGPENERFVIRTEYVNHPLFKLLLEEAESEYGFNSEGPLLLPCEVDRFIKVLLEIMDYDGANDDDVVSECDKGCNFVARSHSSNYHLLLSSPRFVGLNTSY